MIKFFNSIKYKRLVSYLIDIFIVLILVSLLAKVEFLNPFLKKYNKVSKKYYEYMEILSSDSNITSDSLVNDKEYITMVHDVSYYSIYVTIMQFAVIVLYFTLFSFFYDGQTIGKRMTKLRVVNMNNKKKVSFGKCLLRSLILPIYNSLILFIPITLVFNILNVLVFKNITYLYTSACISLIFCIYSYIDVIMYFRSKDGISLHDKILKTKVEEK